MHLLVIGGDAARAIEKDAAHLSMAHGWRQFFGQHTRDVGRVKMYGVDAVGLHLHHGLNVADQHPVGLGAAGI